MKNTLSIFANWKQRRQALQELRAFRTAEEDRLFQSAGNPLLLAAYALEAGDRAAAADHWQEAKLKLGHHLLRSTKSIDILLGLDQIQELEDLMRQGLAKWPTNAQYMVGLARAFEARKDFLRAGEWWLKARKFDSRDAKTVIGYGHCLRKLDRPEEAIVFLRKGTREFPREKDIWVQLARSYEDRGEWKAALECWDHIGQELWESIGIMEAVRVCEKAGDLKGTLARLEEGQVKRPFDKDILIRLAELRERSDDLEAAAETWRRVRQLSKSAFHAYQREAHCLASIGRSEEAQLILAEAADLQGSREHQDHVGNRKAS